MVKEKGKALLKLTPDAGQRKQPGSVHCVKASLKLNKTADV